MALIQLARRRGVTARHRANQLRILLVYPGHGRAALRTRLISPYCRFCAKKFPRPVLRAAGCCDPDRSVQRFLGRGWAPAGRCGHGSPALMRTAAPEVALV